MRKALQLIGNSCLHFGVQVTGIEHCNAAHEVNKAATLDIPQLSVLGAVNEKVAHHSNAAGRGGQATGMPLGIGTGRCRTGKCRRF